MKMCFKNFRGCVVILSRRVVMILYKTGIILLLFVLCSPIGVDFDARNLRFLARNTSFLDFNIAFLGCSIRKSTFSLFEKGEKPCSKRVFASNPLP